MDLKGFLKETRVSQVELSRVFDCSPGNVSNIVTGKRNMTETQVRRLADKYGLDVVSKFASPAEMKFLRPSVPGGTVVSDNASAVQVQSGDNNQISADATLVAVMKQQSDQISSLIAQQQVFLDHQDRLLSLIEACQKQ